MWDWRHCIDKSKGKWWEWGNLFGSYRKVCLSLIFLKIDRKGLDACEFSLVNARLSLSCFSKSLWGRIDTSIRLLSLQLQWLSSHQITKMKSQSLQTQSVLILKFAMTFFRTWSFFYFGRVLKWLIITTVITITTLLNPGKFKRCSVPGHLR